MFSALKVKSSVLKTLLPRWTSHYWDSINYNLSYPRWERYYRRTITRVAIYHSEMINEDGLRPRMPFSSPRGRFLRIRTRQPRRSCGPKSAIPAKGTNFILKNPPRGIMVECESSPLGTGPKQISPPYAFFRVPSALIRPIVTQKRRCPRKGGCSEDHCFHGGGYSHPSVVHVS